MLYKSKEYRAHYMTMAEYKPAKVKRMKVLKIKLAYYAGLFILVACNFALAASNMVLYNLFDFTVKIPEIV
jgi:hypothetical protein